MTARGTGFGVEARSPRELLDVVLGTQSAPPREAVVLVACAATLGVVKRESWGLLRIYVTMLHEGGHALVAVLSRRRVTKILLNANTSGAVHSLGERKGAKAVLGSLAGYPAPGLVALGAAVLIGRGRASLTLCVVACLALLMLVKIRTVYGVFVTIFFVAGLVAVIALADPRAQTGVAHLMAWFLAAGAVRSVFEMLRRRRLGQHKTDDVDNLVAETGLPAAFWMATFVWMVLATYAASALLLAPWPTG
ncbi:M50 family metallopeptidase [Streptodolium elevatio]